MGIPGKEGVRLGLELRFFVWARLTRLAVWGYPGEEGVRLGLEWRFIDSGPFTRLAVGGLRGVVWGCVDCRGL